jgi:mannose-1-phosphate guanylyltransferase
MAKRIALVMAGGGGTRLWPASTRMRPKQVMGLRPDRPGSPSLLGATVARLDGLIAPEDIYVVTARDQVESIRRAASSVLAQNVIAEPRGKNTAPCIALGIQHLRARLGAAAEAATLLALPADHHVLDAEGLRAHLACACAHAEHGNAIVTLGIEPDHPATGYGYVERKDEALPAVPGDGGIPIYPAERFVEKPELETARAFLAAGRFLWNAGIFVMPLSRIAAELAVHCPDTWSALEPAGEALARGEHQAARTAIERAYVTVEAQPIDIAVMEKLEDLRVVPARVGWFDLGSWLSLHTALERDDDQNVVIGGAAVDSTRTLVWSDDPSIEITVLGTTGLAVVASNGRVLVVPLDRAQEVRNVAGRDDDR